MSSKETALHEEFHVNKQRHRVLLIQQLPYAPSIAAAMARHENGSRLVARPRLYLHVRALTLLAAGALELVRRCVRTSVHDVLITLT
jgi:hypothetical protein